ncbi:MAG: hypothetical protein WCS73_06870 [Lentisphaeria bacterium]
MSFNRTHRYFTGIKNAPQEELLASVLEKLKQKIENRYFSKKRCSFSFALYLGGGYGRGEGGVQITNTDTALYNDLDLFLFTQNANRKERAEITKQIRQFCQELEPELKIDIDCADAKRASHLPKLSSRLMYQELRHGHVCITQNMDAIAKIKPLDAKEIPPIEAVRLLVNRGMGLLWALREEGDNNFILRNMHKAVLGAADAFLIFKKRYDYTLENRVKNFNVLVREESLPESYAALYQHAIEFKYRPPLSSGPFSQDKALEIAVFFRDILEKISGYSSNAAPNLSLYCHYTAYLRIRNYVKWVLKTKHFTGCVEASVPLISAIMQIHSFLEMNPVQLKKKDIHSLVQLWKFFG